MQRAARLLARFAVVLALRQVLPHLEPLNVAALRLAVVLLLLRQLPDGVLRLGLLRAQVTLLPQREGLPKKERGAASRGLNEGRASGGNQSGDAGGEEAREAGPPRAPRAAASQLLMRSRDGCLDACICAYACVQVT